MRKEKAPRNRGLAWWARHESNMRLLPCESSDKQGNQTLTERGTIGANRMRSHASAPRWDRSHADPAVPSEPVSVPIALEGPLSDVPDFAEPIDTALALLLFVLSVVVAAFGVALVGLRFEALPLFLLPSAGCGFVSAVIGWGGE